MFCGIYTKALCLKCYDLCYFSLVWATYEGPIEIKKNEKDIVVGPYRGWHSNQCITCGEINFNQYCDNIIFLHVNDIIFALPNSLSLFNQTQNQFNQPIKIISF